MQGNNRVKLAQTGHCMCTLRICTFWTAETEPGEASERKAWHLYFGKDAGRSVPTPIATQHMWGWLEDRPYEASPHLPELHAEFISWLSILVKALTEWLPKDKDQGWFWTWPGAQQELVLQRHIKLSFPSLGAPCGLLICHAYQSAFGWWLLSSLPQKLLRRFSALQVTTGLWATQKRVTPFRLHLSKLTWASSHVPCLISVLAWCVDHFSR